MKSSYRVPEVGKNDIKHYIGSFLTIFILTSILTAFVISFQVGFVENDGNAGTYYDVEQEKIVGLSPVFEFISMHVIYIGWLLAMVIAIKTIHKRPLRTLVTNASRMDWKKVFQGYGVFFGLMALLLGVTLFATPDSLVWNVTNWKSYFLFFFLILLLTPLQTTVEELYFRGYLVQMIGKKVKHPIILSLIVAVVFGGMHFGNPEMSYNALIVGVEYLFVGYMLTYLSLKTGSSEWAIGAHAANNTFLFWFLTMENSVGEHFPSLFKVTDPDPVVSLIGTLFLFSGFYLYVKKRTEKRKQTE